MVEIENSSRDVEKQNAADDTRSVVRQKPADEEENAPEEANQHGKRYEQMNQHRALLCIAGAKVR